MDPKLQEIIKASTLEVQQGTYVYCKVSKKPRGDHFLISQDKEEITVVTLFAIANVSHIVIPANAGI